MKFETWCNDAKTGVKATWSESKQIITNAQYMCNKSYIFKSDKWNFKDIQW